MVTRKKMVAGNWKMNNTHQQSNALIADIVNGLSTNTTSNCDVVVCPPYVYLESVANQLNSYNVALGAQDVSAYQNGAYTGQISARMLGDVGCKYVIIGHSERRQYCLEDNELIARKLTALIQADLKPILCVGETQSERDAGQTEKVVLQQITSVAESCGVEAIRQTVIAYEPIWAIGTGLTATPSQAQSVHKMIRQAVAAMEQELADKLPILYGGSVKASNAAELFQMEDIDGGLIGGASLLAKDFIQICDAAAMAS